MTFADLLPLLPIIIVAACAVVVMLQAAFHRSHALAAGLTVLGLALALATLPLAAGHGPRQITPLIIVDAYAVFFTGLICWASLAATLLAYDYLKPRSGRREEFYVLLLLATLGTLVLVSSNHFASLFLGLEILSVALYALIAYRRPDPAGIEAGLKYLVLAAASAAFLLFGMALTYAASGALDFASIAQIRSETASEWMIVSAGLTLMIVGFGFKLALAPFHLWTPDVYQGAPAPVAAFIATVSKGAMFVVLLRLFRHSHLEPSDAVLLVLAIIAAASMFAGNLLALLQTNVKRMLAYSSIAHLGYLLVALLAGNPLADTAVVFYLTAYFITMLGAFGVVGILSGTDRDAEAMSDYQGLAWRRPWLAASMTAMLLSLAGIPLTAGFLGKFYVLSAGAASSLWWLVLILVVNSAIGLFYYLRLMIVMFALPAEAASAAASDDASSLLARRRTPLGDRTLAALTILVVWLGVDPALLIRNIIHLTFGNN